MRWKALLFLVLALFLAGCQPNEVRVTPAAAGPRLTLPPVSPVVIYLSSPTPETPTPDPTPPETVRPPLTTQATAQQFEHGVIIRLQDPGRYYILVNRLLYPGQDPVRRVLYVIEEPLTLLEDTGDRVTAPSGYYLPQNELGLVWRGDVGESPGFRSLLGWAVAPAFDYEAMLRCLPASERSDLWTGCHLTTPAGEVYLPPLGGWEPPGSGPDYEGEGASN